MSFLGEALGDGRPAAVTQKHRGVREVASQQLTGLEHRAVARRPRSDPQATIAYVQQSALVDAYRGDARCAPDRCDRATGAKAVGGEDVLACGDPDIGR